MQQRASGMRGKKINWPFNPSLGVGAQLKWEISRKEVLLTQQMSDYNEPWKGQSLKKLHLSLAVQPQILITQITYGHFKDWLGEQNSGSLWHRGLSGTLILITYIYKMYWHNYAKMRAKSNRVQSLSMTNQEIHLGNLPIYTWSFCCAFLCATKLIWYMSTCEYSITWRLSHQKRRAIFLKAEFHPCWHPRL